MAAAIVCVLAVWNGVGLTAVLGRVAIAFLAGSVAAFLAGRALMRTVGAPPRTGAPEISADSGSAGARTPAASSRTSSRASRAAVDSNAGPDGSAVQTPSPTVSSLPPRGGSSSAESRAA